MIEFINDNTDTFLMIILIIGYIVFEILFNRKIKKIKLKINKKYSEEKMENIENIDSLDQDLYIEYYKGKNIIRSLRFALLFSGVLSIILFKIPGIFSVLAIAIGAIIITFKETILSFFGFFYISAHFKIGENILLGDNNNIRGEIIYINILNVGLVGKDENGEHNGQFYNIPNFKLIVDNVKREDLGIGKYKKEEFEIHFNNDLFKITFEDFLNKLRLFLDENLVKKNIGNVGNYKTYIGYKYKLRFKYDKNYLIINISIIEKQKTILDIQNKIALFVESHKKVNIE